MNPPFLTAAQQSEVDQFTEYERRLFESNQEKYNGLVARIRETDEELAIQLAKRLGKKLEDSDKRVLAFKCGLCSTVERPRLQSPQPVQIGRVH